MSRLVEIVRLAGWSARALFRDRQLVFWNFGFFTLLLVLFVGVLSRGDPSLRVALTTTIVTLTVAANALFSLGVGLATAREEGQFRRLSLTPLPPWAALAAVVAARALLVFSAAVVQLLLARLLFDVGWSGGAGAVLAVLLMGTVALATVGVLLAAMAPAPRVANALVNVVLLPMLALGGTVLPLSMLPAGVAAVARGLPVTALADGLTAALIAGAGVVDLAAEIALLGTWALCAGALGGARWMRA